MKFWSLFFIACLELLSNAPRATEPNNESSEVKVSQSRIDGLDADKFTLDKEENKSVDQPIVKAIRQNLLNNSSLSDSARNIQIIVVKKEITLKGPVASETEKQKVLDTAKNSAKDHQIRNQLEVITE